MMRMMKPTTKKTTTAKTGDLIPISPEDIENEYDEDDLRWALANYQAERKKWRLSECRSVQE